MAGFSRLSTKTWPTNEITSSPAWLRPMVRIEISPQPGRERLARLPITSFVKGDRVAGIDRLQPFQLVEAGRGAEPRRPADPIAARSRATLLHPADIKPHPHRERVPAGGAEPSEVARRGGRLVGVEGLRVEGRGEALDLLRGKGVAPISAARRPRCPRRTSWPAVAARRDSMIGFSTHHHHLAARVRHLVAEANEAAVGLRLFEARTSSTIERPESVSPGRTGRSHFRLSTPGEPIDAASLQPAVDTTSA